MSTAAKAPPSKSCSRRDTARAKANRTEFKALTKMDRLRRAIQDLRHVHNGAGSRQKRHFFGGVSLIFFISPDMVVAEGAEQLTPKPN